METPIGIFRPSNAWYLIWKKKRKEKKYSVSIWQEMRLDCSLWMLSQKIFKINTTNVNTVHNAF